MNVICLSESRNRRQAATALRRYVRIRTLADALLEELDKVIDGPDPVERAIWRRAHNLIEKLSEEVASSGVSVGEILDRASRARFDGGK